jgi:hypothetical protein
MTEVYYYYWYCCCYYYYYYYCCCYFIIIADVTEYLQAGQQWNHSSFSDRGKVQAVGPTQRPTIRWTPGAFLSGIKWPGIRMATHLVVSRLRMVGSTLRLHGVKGTLIMLLLLSPPLLQEQRQFVGEVAGWWTKCGSMSGRDKLFSLLLRVQTCSWVHRRYYSLGTGRCLITDKAAEAWNWLIISIWSQR